METLIKYKLLVFFIFSFTLLSAQDANFNKTLEAFKTSYERENNEQIKEAISALTEVYDAASYEMNLRLGWLCYQAGQLNTSKNYYQKAIDLKPFAIEPKFGMTYPVYAMGNKQELISVYDDILKTAPNNTIALYNLGNVYFYQKNYEAAEKLFSKVVNLFPFDYDALIMLAHTNFHMKKFREAKVLNHKVLLFNPDDAIAKESLELLK